MSTNRRDFMKGIAALAACIPVIGTTKCVVEKAEPVGSNPLIGEAVGVQRHGDQPDFYIHSWNLEHFVDQVMVGRSASGRRIIVQEEDIIHMEVYTEQPSEMLAWCETNLLTVKLPQISKTLRVKVNTMESMLLGRASDVIMTIDGVVKS